MDFLYQQLLANQFLAGGFILGVAGCVVALVRKWPGEIWTRLKSYFIIEVDIQGYDEAFQWVNLWLSHQSYSKRTARVLTVITRTPWNSDPEELNSSRPEIIFSPAPGNHLLKFRGVWVLLHRERKDPAGKERLLPIETFNLKFFTRNRAVAEQLLEEARELVYPPDDDRLRILNARWDDWNLTSRRRPRPEGSVILKSGVLETILKSIKDFKVAEQWYVDRGIPWRLGILLFGPPGSGKSSTVAAIASHFKMDIAILNLNMKGLDDNQLNSYLADCPKNALVLLEDIDCVFSERKGSEDKDNQVTFSGLLNAIDGVAASEGRILFMTTNYVEKLDPALIRPGRVDVKFEIGSPDRDQVMKLFWRFYPESVGLAEGFVAEGKSMAALQGHFLKYRRAEDALSNPVE